VSLRPLAALVLVAAAIWIGMNFVPHHTDENPFKQLYAHLMAAPLVTNPHAEHGAEQHFALSVSLPFLPAAMDLDPHKDGPQLVATNLQLFQVVAVLLVLIAFSGVAAHVRNGGGDWVSRRMSGFALWVRDEMVYPAMGPELGRKFLPWFLTLFFFILFMNLLGLLPGGATATASIFVTAALALVTLLSMLICGMVAQGPIAYWKHLVPHVPLVLWPLMFVVEVVGVLVKPFALMVRLFANMTGGHMVVLSFMGLIFFFAAKSAAIGWAVSPVAVGFAVFIMIIEAFVALLQAFIFTQLSILFVSASVHPEH
jgi:F-type H+-transporting ATPase subunit a